MSAQRVVVIGAGVIGACTAYALASAGIGVTVVEATAGGRGLSAHSFGWFNPVTTGHESYYRLTIAALAANQRLADRLPAPHWYHPVGNLQWAYTETDQALLDRTALDYRRRGYPVTELDRVGVLAQEPNLRLGTLAGAAVRYPRDGYVVGDRLVDAALHGARELGATIVSGDAVAGFPHDDPARGVRLASGRTLAADRVVCCAGSRTNDVLALLGERLPVAEPGDGGRLTRGLLVRTTPVRRSVRQVVHAPGLSIRPQPGGRLVLHCHDLDELLTGDDDADALSAEVLARLHRVLPQGETAGPEVAAAYLGVRPMPLDGMSMLGPLPDQPALYVMLTHSGLTLAAVVAEIAARELTGTPHPLAADFRPDRLLTA